MKCSMCGGPAVINMRQHKLRLCTAHFLDWFPRPSAANDREVRDVRPEDRVLVAVSGGKDSLALWDVLLRHGLSRGRLFT